MESSYPWRSVLITGASRGLGAALAEACAAECARLILTARTRGALEEVDDRLRAQGAEAALLPLDLAEGEPIDRLGKVNGVKRVWDQRLGSSSSR